MLILYRDLQYKISITTIKVCLTAYAIAIIMNELIALVWYLVTLMPYFYSNGLYLYLITTLYCYFSMYFLTMGNPKILLIFNFKLFHSAK